MANRSVESVARDMAFEQGRKIYEQRNPRVALDEQTHDESEKHVQKALKKAGVEHSHTEKVKYQGDDYNHPLYGKTHTIRVHGTHDEKAVSAAVKAAGHTGRSRGSSVNANGPGTKHVDYGLMSKNIKEETVTEAESEIIVEPTVEDIDESEKIPDVVMDVIEGLLETVGYSQLDELSKKTLGSYISKANDSHDKAKARFRADGDKDYDTWDRDTKNLKTMSKRRDGISKATKKLNKEEYDELNELSKHTLKSYVGKAATDGMLSASSGGYGVDRHKNKRNMLKRQKGIFKAVDKLAKEEFELSEDAKDYHKKHVQGLYNYSHFQHDNGSFVQIRNRSSTRDKSYHAVHQDKHGTQKSFDSHEDLHNHLKTIKEDLDENTLSAKAGEHGVDLGKRGKNFSKIANKAAHKYGSKEAGDRVAGAILNKMRNEDFEAMDDELIDEAMMVYELSHKTLKSYRDKAENEYDHYENGKQSRRTMQKAWQRNKGIGSATRRLPDPHNYKGPIKEDVDLEEADKHSKTDFHYQEQPGKTKRAFNLQRYLSNNEKKQKAAERKEKSKTHKEEVELDEISKSTLHSYLGKVKERDGENGPGKQYPGPKSFRKHIESWGTAKAKLGSKAKHTPNVKVKATNEDLDLNASTETISVYTETETCNDDTSINRSKEVVEHIMAQRGRPPKDPVKYAAYLKEKNQSRPDDDQIEGARPSVYQLQKACDNPLGGQITIGEETRVYPRSVCRSALAQLRGGLKPDEKIALERTMFESHDSFIRHTRPG